MNKLIEKKNLVLKYARELKINFTVNMSQKKQNLNHCHSLRFRLTNKTKTFTGTLRSCLNFKTYKAYLII